MLPGLCSAKIPELWPKPSLGMLWGSYGVVLALLEPRYCRRSQRDAGCHDVATPELLAVAAGC